MNSLQYLGISIEGHFEKPFNLKGHFEKIFNPFDFQNVLIDESNDPDINFFFC